MTPVNFAYVGCGFVAQSIHIPNFRSLPECSFLAIAETREDLGRQVTEHFRIPRIYRSHMEIAEDPEIEAVGVSAPYALQGQIAEDLLRAGKHVFMEKPMAVTLERARRLVRAEKEGSARLMVAYMKRYDPGNLRLKHHLDLWRASGEAGRILFARNHGFGGNWIYAQDPQIPIRQSLEQPPAAPQEFPPWLPDDRKHSYLGYLQQWTHNVNLLRFFLDDREGSARPQAVQLDDDGLTGVVILDIKGIRAVVESGYTKYHAWDEHTQIYFEKGWLRTEASALMQKETTATVEIYRSGIRDQPPQLTREYPSPAWPYREEARHFLEHLRSGLPFASTAADTLHDVRLFEEIYRLFIGV